MNDRQSFMRLQAQPCLRLLATLTLMLSALLLPAVARADSLISQASPDRYFSPNGDGREDTLSVSYRLESPASVDIVVRDAAEHVVRTLATAEDRDLGWHDFGWDGRDASGNVVPDGVYRYTLTARGGDAVTETVTGRLGVDIRTPARFVEPERDAAVTGGTTARVAPASGLTLTAAHATVASCRGGDWGLGHCSQSAWLVDVDGSIALPFDTDTWRSGPNLLQGSVQYDDQFGQSHSAELAAQPVMVIRPPRISLGSADRYFSPNEDGQEDSISVLYELSAPAHVDVIIRDAEGGRVRLIESGTSRGEDWQTFTWNGRDDGGALAADGVYTYTLVAQGAIGEPVSVSGRVGVDSRVPVRVVSPLPGDVVSGAVVVRLEPAAGLSLDSATARVGSCRESWWSPPGCYQWGVPSGFDDGVELTLNTADWYTGASSLLAWASYVDQFGQAHSFGLPELAVTVPARPVQVTEVSADRYFSPNGDGQDDSTSLSFALSEPARTSVVVTDGDGTVIRTLESDQARGSGWQSLGWDGLDANGAVVADGVYRWTVTAAGEAGEPVSASGRIGIDIQPPGVVTAPKTGDTVSGIAQYAYLPRDGDKTTGVTFCVTAPWQCANVFGESQDGGWRTSRDTLDLADGGVDVVAYVFYADAFGAAHTAVFDVPIIVDNTTPNVDLTVTPLTGRAPHSVDATVNAYQPRGATLDYSLDFGDGTERITGSSGPPYAPIATSHVYAQPGTYRVRVSVSDGQGHSSARTADVTVQPAKVNQAPTASLTVSPTDGTAPLDVTATAGASDADDDALTYAIDFGDGTNDRGELPHAPMSHRYTAAGSYLVRLEVSDGRLSDSRTARVTVADTTTPETTIDAGPDGLTMAAGPFSFNSDDADASFECAVDAGAWYGCVSPLTVTGLTDGDHTFRVRATDQAGNPDGSPAERRFILDTTAPVVAFTGAPSGPIATNAVRIAFTVDDAAAQLECSLDGRSFDACASPVDYDGLADGAHEVRVRATDTAGNGSAVATTSFSVDTVAPNTTLTAVPRDPTNAETPSVSFASEAGASFACSIDGGPYRACESPLALPGLDEGDHTVDIRATDAAGRSEEQPAHVLFEIDRTPPDTTITRSPTQPFHEGGVFGFASSEDGPFECTVDDGPWAACDPDYYDDYPIDLIGVTPGLHRFRARSYDRAGNVDPDPAEATFTLADEAPVAELTVTPDEGAANLRVAVTVGGSDADHDALDYEIDFGDGTTDTGALPDAEPFDHTYAHAGLFVVRLEVSDGYTSDVATHTVRVVLPEPLEAEAGDDLEGVVGEPVKLDGGGSRPLVGIERYRWQLGDGQTADGSTVDHVYDEPGSYKATLTTTAGDQSDSDTATVHIVAATEARGLRAAVTSNGAPLAGADVLVMRGDGTRVSGISDGDGRVRLRGLADGEYKVMSYASGHLPAAVTATVRDGVGDVVIDLKRGDVATAKVTSHVMTYDEIVAAGIDPDDPDNQHVYQFTVNIEIADLGDGGGGGGSGGGASFGGYLAGGGFIGEGLGGLTCRRLVCKGTTRGGVVTITQQEIAPGVPGLTTLVIPFKARWLKEFFDVSMTVTNLAEDQSFVLRHGSAMLELPAGLALAPTARGERLTVPVDDIPAGGSAKANWIVRGDVEGDYRLTARYGATLEPFGRAFALDATMEDPLRVWGGSALKLTVDVDDQSLDGYPYHVRVGLKNVADVPVYNPAVELLKDGRHGYIEQPVQQREFSAAAIAPGDTFWAGPFIVVPEASGSVDLGKSFIKKVAGDVSLEATLVTSPRNPSFDDTPTAAAHARLNAVVIDFELPDGGSDFQVFSTPDRQTDFPGEALPSETLDAGKIKVAATPGHDDWYAISTSHGGRRELIHPIARAEASSTEIWPQISAQIGRCGVNDQDLTVSMHDPDVQLTRWSYRFDGGPWHDGGALSGRSATKRIAVEIGDDPTVVEVAAQNAEQAGVAGADAHPGDGSADHPAYGPVRKTVMGKCNYVAIGDSVSAGEGIGYGYEWHDETGRWTPTDGGSSWLVDEPEPQACHQTLEAHPRLIAEHLGLRLTHLACTGATFDEGIAGVQPQRDLSVAQVGGFAGGSPSNSQYTDAKPDVVTVSLGANDIGFENVVIACFYVGKLCNSQLEIAESRLVPGGEVARRLDELYTHLQELAAEAHRPVLFLQTEYVNPFPDATHDRSCFDISGGLGSGFSTEEIDRMNAGLRQLNSLIRTAASRHPGVIAVPAPAAFEDHRFCSKDPWIFGMDIGLDWQLDVPLPSPKQKAPFHPTADGQAAIAQEVERYLNASEPMGAEGKDIDVRFESGVKLRFAQVQEPGTTVVVKTQESELPGHPAFQLRQGYQIDTAAQYSGSVEVSLPAQPGDKMWHYHDGAWEQVQATYDGSMLQGSVTSFSPFAVGPAVTAVKARVSASGGDVAPADVSFDATGSDGPVSDVTWEFGDGTTASGTRTTHRYALSGNYTVTATARSADGAADRATTKVTVGNPGPHVVADVPTKVRLGSKVTLDSTASSDLNGTVRDGWWIVDGEAVVPLSQRSEVTFDHPGEITIEAVVRDDELKQSSRSFTVTVSGDTDPPELTGVPEDVLVEALSKDGAPATYDAPIARDAADGGVPVSCEPASGSRFPMGSTTVSCTATDSAGNAGRANFTVTVRDTRGPVLDGTPGDAAIEATSRAGAPFTYATPTADDLVDGARPVSCTPGSGSTLALGKTTVRCTAVDNAGNSGRSSFDVTVTDSAPPRIDGTPEDQTAVAVSSAGAPVAWPAPSAIDAVDDGVQVACSPASGSVFPIGSTVVRCSAADTAGNVATSTFTVTVRSEVVAGLTAGRSQRIDLFSATRPGTVVRSIAVPPLKGRVALTGLAYRPSNGMLYAFDADRRLYRIDPSAGRFTTVGRLTALPRGELGFDFEPATNVLRIVSASNADLRVNVDAVKATADPSLAYAKGDPNARKNPTVTALAHASDGSTVRRYGIDSLLGQLVVLDPPTGLLRTVGPLGFKMSNDTGFDVSSRTGVAWAALARPKATESRWYSIDLRTGAATDLGRIGNGAIYTGAAIMGTTTGP